MLVNVKIVVADSFQKLGFLLLGFIVIVKNVPLANHLKVRVDASFFNSWSCHHPDFEYFPNCCGHHKVRVRNFAPVFHKVVEIIDIPNLRWNCDSFPIFSPDFAVIDQGLVSARNKLNINQIATDNYAGATFSRLAMNSCHILI